MEFVKLCQPIFEAAIRDYHVTDNVDTPISNPYPQGQIEHDLYLKCWIDTVQWHFEDIIRDPAIDPAAALVLKRRIDKSNQDRTDLVERIDSYFLTVYLSSHRIGIKCKVSNGYFSFLLNICSSEKSIYPHQKFIQFYRFHHIIVYAYLESPLFRCEIIPCGHEKYRYGLIYTSDGFSKFIPVRTRQHDIRYDHFIQIVIHLVIGIIYSHTALRGKTII